MRIDITGKRFRHVTVLSYSHSLPRGTVWNCRCDCGVIKKIRRRQLIRKDRDALCGCQKRALGLSKSRTYGIWEGMMARCYSKNRKEFPKYGGAGLRVSNSWKKFKNFYRDMGECPKNLTIERIDNSKGYSKDNCKWATRQEQNRNHSRNVNITYKGKTRCLADWAKEFGLHHNTLTQRYRSGIPLSQVFRPVDKRYS